LAIDPECAKNLAEKPEYREKATGLRAQLFEQLKKQVDPRLLGNPEVFDHYPHAKPGLAAPAITQ
jgi:N-sulfoglucosamine sulfohydrolase